MKKQLAALLLPLLLLTGCKVQKGKEPVYPSDITAVSDRKYTCTFEDVKYEYVLDLPEKTENAPLILMLHGYGDSAEGFRSSVHLEQTANPLGYAVAYVGSGIGWNSGIEETGNPDAAFLVSLAQYLQHTYGFAQDCTYAAGFSNGAFMTHRLAAEACDTFSACISVAGMMPQRIWEKLPDYWEFPEVGFLQITGQKDAVVPQGEEQSEPDIYDVVRYYTETDGLIIHPFTIGNDCLLFKASAEDKRPQVWHLVIPEGGHTWQSGSSGVDTNALIMEFLEAQRTPQNSAS